MSTNNAAEQIVVDARNNPMTAHPFFQRMQSEPANMTGLWCYYANLSEVTARVPNWLANILQRTDDFNLKCLVASILHDELGSGKTDKIHCKLMDKMIDGLSPWKPQKEKLNPLEGGTYLANKMESFFAGDSVDVDWAIGSLIAGETFAEQMIFALAKEIRRQNELSLDIFEWQIAHEEVEEQHAQSSAEMSNFVPESGPRLESVFKGAEWKKQTLNKWLDFIYRATYA